MRSIEDYRQFYAKFAVMQAGAKDEKLIAAFSSVERERFLGKGPWSIVTQSGYLPTPSDDPPFREAHKRDYKSFPEHAALEKIRTIPSFCYSNCG